MYILTYSFICDRFHSYFPLFVFTCFIELFPFDDNASALGASMSIVPDQNLLLLNTYMYLPTMTIITILFCPPSISRGEAEGSVVNSVLKPAYADSMKTLSR